ncbi:asparaginase [Gracilibacillus orientalis]|uniref:Asparaginase n=1 Tax=Gracilibacillus orientalis TaxID=334253 RepID=A0A1I4JS05_9BACI|nr:asparaginase [Gracilibacillus orientalis]SFL69013.1 asparaginase [Gracilibacillus orientalis]
MNFPVIAKEFRNGNVENIHQGVICVLDKNKKVVFKKGDITQPFYYRSAMKPIQAIPVFSSNIINKYQLTGEETALFTASQRGEDYHEKALSSLAEKLGIEEKRLVCNESYPLNAAPKEKYIASHKSRRKLLHNCAGKHLGFLANAKEKDLSVDNYHEMSHPLQQDVLDYVSILSETPKDRIITGLDGCGVPVHAVPLQNMAISYLKFADILLINNASLRVTVNQITQVMNNFPNIVASHQFICSTLLEDRNIIAKGGAQGVYCLALRKEKISIAIKVLSGTEHLWPLLVAKILEKFQYQNKATIDRLYALKDINISNDSGKIAGHTEIYL